MPEMPDKHKQIIQAHTALIHRVVAACGSASLAADLEPILNTSEANGWGALVGAIRLILSGRRDAAVLAGLDEEDTVVAEAILRGIQDPKTLPDPQAKPDPSLAAPGLAAMIDAAARGNTQALEMLGAMAQQMSRAGGDMARLAALIRPLVNGEREAEKLLRGMGPQGRSLVLGILGELGKLGRH